jgi:heat shock protein HslJ
MIMSRQLVVAMLAAAVAGCSERAVPTAPENASLASQLAGTWTLFSIQPSGAVEQPTPNGAEYNLTFGNGRLSARADCNTCGGTFTVSGQTMTAGPALACTRAACPTMAFENMYTTMLAGDSTVTVSDRVLMLTSARGVLRFTR